jgi:hypothetical protein
MISATTKVSSVEPYDTMMNRLSVFTLNSIGRERYHAHLTEKISYSFILSKEFRIQDGLDHEYLLPADVCR